MNKLLFLIVVFFVFVFPSKSAELSGSNAEYSGETIRFFRYTDPVALQIGRAHV